MPFFLVQGVRRTDRSDVRLVIEADSADNARVKLELQGCTVTSITPLSGAAAAASAGPKPCNPWAVMLLSVITLSIYGDIWFYESGKAYARVTGEEASTSFPSLFWWYFALSLIGGLTLPIGLGVLLLIASLVLGVLALGEFIRLRDLCASKLGVHEGLMSGTTHRTLWTLGFVLSFVLVGIFILIAQAIYLIRDHNLIAERASRVSQH